jgi:hypothetical protein
MAFNQIPLKKEAKEANQRKTLDNLRKTTTLVFNAALVKQGFKKI